MANEPKKVSTKNTNQHKLMAMGKPTPQSEKSGKKTSDKK